jgi:hypothetical protein
MPPTNARDERALHHICEKEIDVDAFFGPGGIRYDSNADRITSAMGVARVVRPEIITGYEARPPSFAIPLEEEGRRRRNNQIEFVGINHGLRANEEVWPWDH